MKDLKNKGTQCVHSGVLLKPVAKGVNTPIFTSTSYAYLDTDERLYPRYFNTPNNQVLIDKICALEMGEEGLIFSSGMAAISTTLLALLQRGDHAVFQPGIYGGTFHFIQQKLDLFGINYSFAASQQIGDLRAAATPATKLVFIETPSNPLLTITDIQAVADWAQHAGYITVIDNTFASPINQNPLDLGIDVVTHSATKYLGGHSDICAGVAVSSKELMAPVMEMARSLGGSLDPYTCYLLERSIKTLAVRVKQQNENAMAVAQHLHQHPGVNNVFYPGLPTHSQHNIASRQMSGFGGMLSFETRDVDGATFQKKLKLIKPSMSLGGVESIICSPVLTSHASLTREERKNIGINDNLLRLSIGIEDAADIISDLDQAF